MSSLLGRLRAPRKSPTTPNTPAFSDNANSNIHASMIGMAATPGVHAGIHTQGDYFQQANGQQQLQSGQQQERLPLYLCQPFVKAALVKGSFKTIVAPPKYVDVNEWVAINIFDFYNNLNHFYGAISEFCGPHQCHTMSAASGLDFTWPDQNKRQVSLPASTYIDYVMSWVQRLLEDESVFPTKSGRDFQPSFPSTAKHIYKQLFRIFAHIYHAHFSEILHLSLEAHFNSLFAHYIAFGREYDLLDAQDTIELRTRGGGVMWLTDKWAEMGILEGGEK